MSEFISRGEVYKVLFDHAVDRAVGAATDADLAVRQQAREGASDARFAGEYLGTDTGLFTMGQPLGSG